MLSKMFTLSTMSKLSTMCTMPTVTTKSTLAILKYLLATSSAQKYSAGFICRQKS